nr:unnamed protein product [Spirometra erinaceieuropaei]
MDLFATACDNFRLVINTEKAMFMHQLPPDAAYGASKINENGAQLQVVDNFIYLGDILSCNTKINDEAARQISKTSQVFGLLRTNCDIKTTPVAVSPLNSASSPTSTTNTDHTPEPPPPSSSSSTAPKSTAAAPVATTTAHNSDTPTNINLSAVNGSDVNSIHTCPYCDCIFNSHIGPVGHLRIHRTETGEPVNEAPT